MDRGRPNWWVILAVSLALMALLVATAGNPKRVTGGTHDLASAQSGDAHGAQGSSRSTSTARSTTTTTLAPAHTGATALTSTHAATVPTTTEPPAPASSPATATTTTTVPMVVPTTTTSEPAEPMGAGSHQGVIEPPAQRSGSVGFTGTGSMQISVVWSTSTYLTMQISCPNGSQNVGGSSAMEASLPDATGSCLATVSEPDSETTALTYTITIGPSGG
jgi:hypothetical protein